MGRSIFFAIHQTCTYPHIHPYACFQLNKDYTPLFVCAATNKPINKMRVYCNGSGGSQPITYCIALYIVFQTPRARKQTTEPNVHQCDCLCSHVLFASLARRRPEPPRDSSTYHRGNSLLFGGPSWPLPTNTVLILATWPHGDPIPQERYASKFTLITWYIFGSCL